MITEKQANRIIELLEEIENNTSTTNMKLGTLKKGIKTMGDRISEIAHDVDDFKKKQKRN